MGFPQRNNSLACLTKLVASFVHGPTRRPVETRVGQSAQVTQSVAITRPAAELHGCRLRLRGAVLVVQQPFLVRWKDPSARPSTSTAPSLSTFRVPDGPGLALAISAMDRDDRRVLAAYSRWCNSWWVATPWNSLHEAKRSSVSAHASCWIGRRRCRIHATPSMLPCCTKA